MEPGKLVSLYDIGVPLVPAGFTQHEIVDALFVFEMKE